MVKAVYGMNTLPISYLVFFLYIACVSSDTDSGYNPKGFFLSLDSPTIQIAFRPDDGINNRQKFQNKYGIKGERLIASFGNGGVVPEEKSLIEQINFMFREETTVKAIPSHEKIEDSEKMQVNYFAQDFIK